MKPHQKINGRPIIYSNGCAAITRDAFGACVVYVLESKRKKYERVNYFNGNPKKDYSRAKKICDRHGARNKRQNIGLGDYPDMDEFVINGHRIGFIVFVLFLFGSDNIAGAFTGAESSNVLFSIFSSEGFVFFLTHWWQITLLFLLPASLGAFFWGLSCDRQFPIAFRLFSGAFGKIQVIGTTALLGVIALYWAIVGLWRSVFSHVSDALGYPYFVAATICLAIIVWGIVDFMKYRKQPGRSAA